MSAPFLFFHWAVMGTMQVKVFNNHTSGDMTVHIQNYERMLIWEQNVNNLLFCTDAEKYRKWMICCKIIQISSVIHHIYIFMIVYSWITKMPTISIKIDHWIIVISQSLKISEVCMSKQPHTTWLCFIVAGHKYSIATSIYNWKCTFDVMVDLQERETKLSNY